MRSRLVVAPKGRIHAGVVRRSEAASPAWGGAWTVVPRRRGVNLYVVPRRHGPSRRIVYGGGYPIRIGTEGRHAIHDEPPGLMGLYTARNGEVLT